MRAGALPFAFHERRHRWPSQKPPRSVYGLQHRQLRLLVCREKIYQEIAPLGERGHDHDAMRREPRVFRKHAPACRPKGRRAPSPAATLEEVTECVAVLDEVMASDPLQAREQRQRLFEGGRVLLEPQLERAYVAVGRIDLGAFLTTRFAPPTADGPSPLSRDPGLPDGPAHSWSSHRCAGARLRATRIVVSCTRQQGIRRVPTSGVLIS